MGKLFLPAASAAKINYNEASLATAHCHRNFFVGSGSNA
jgi:hypothetical protein